MKESEKITEQDIAQTKVKLKSVLGVSPRTYVPAIYILIVFVLVFFILINPALRNPGAQLVFKGAPEAAAVFIDGAYQGNSLDGVHARPGKHQLQIQKTGFSAQTLDVAVPNRIFATILFPPKVRVAYELKPDSASAILDPAFSSFAAWSLTGRPSAIYQIPMSLSESARDLSAFSPSERADLASPVMAASLSTAENSSSLRDAIYTTATLGAPGASPLGYIAFARSAAALLARSSNFSVALSEIVSEKEFPGMKDAAASASRQAASLSPSHSPRAGSISAGPLSFIMFAPGSVNSVITTPGGTQVPYAASTPAFGLSSTEVTRAEFNRFLAQNPSWKPENRADLIAKGLADASYLATYDAAKSDSVPITGVSWFAASAYCDWLSAQAPAGYKVVLPTEAMWNAASAADAKNPVSFAVFSDRSSSGPLPVGSSGRDSLGFADLYGNVWEWTSDGFRPYPWILDSSATFAELTSAIASKTVLGGSWANKPDAISAGIRGPVPAIHASEFLGFRPAIVQK